MSSNMIFCKHLVDEMNIVDNLITVTFPIGIHNWFHDKVMFEKDMFD